MEAKNITCRISIIIVTILLPILICGQTNTFKIITSMETNYDFAHSIAIQPDEKVIVAGDSYGIPCMIRFDNEGALDPSFGNEGRVFTSWDGGSNPVVNDITVLSDGRIILGSSYNNGNNRDFILACFNPDGSIDESFGNNGTTVTPIGNFEDICFALAMQPDGKLLAAGGSNKSMGAFDYNFALVRYNPDGTLDNSFGNSGVVITEIGLYNSIAYSIAVQQDGRILLAGETQDSLYAFNDFAVVRYNEDGSLDSTFGTDGKLRMSLSETYDYAKSMVLQEDGKIVITGYTQNGLHNYDFALLRLNTDGSFDDTFGNNGIVITDIGNDFANSIAIQQDGKIVLAGSTTTGTLYDFATLRYNQDGSLDETFGENGAIITSFGAGDDEGSSVVIRNNGEILIAGMVNTQPGSFDSDFALLRLFSDLTIGVNYKSIDLSIISVIPNPVTTGFTINYFLPEAGRISISLSDIQGKKIQILKDDKLQPAGSHYDSFLLSNTIAPGLYLLEIKTKDYIKSVRIIKQ